jgi:hypothetical protein
LRRANGRLLAEAHRHRPCPTATLDTDATLAAAFKAAVQSTPESERRPLMRKEGGKEAATGREWAEECCVPNKVCAKKRGRERRCPATREVLREPPLPGTSGQPDLPFPTLDFNAAVYQVFGVATNRDLAGDQIILWRDRRAGRSEEAHAVMKNDLAGPRFPSGEFGENAGWRSITILAFNLHSLFRSLVLGGRRERIRLKALRLHFINLPGRVFLRARRLVIRIAGSHPSLEAPIAARGRVLSSARSPLWRGLVPAPAFLVRTLGGGSGRGRGVFSGRFILSSAFSGGRFSTIEQAFASWSP